MQTEFDIRSKTSIAHAAVTVTREEADAFLDLVTSKVENDIEGSSEYMSKLTPEEKRQGSRDLVHTVAFFLTEPEQRQIIDVFGEPSRNAMDLILLEALRAAMSGQESVTNLGNDTLH